MPQGEFQVSPGPHIWRGFSVNRIMYLTALVLLLPVGAATYFFGLRALFIVLTSVVFSLLTEWGCKKIRGKPFVMDGSAIITGMLLALTLPAAINLWMVALGAVFAIGIVKEAFGGLGYNIFNPALAARALLAASFPKAMTTWLMPFSVDAVSTATPLSNNFAWSSRLAARLALYQDMFFGNRAGSMGETSVVILIVGGILLIALQLIDWEVPLIFVGTTVAVGALFGEDPVLQLLSGGLLLCAIFMATDPVTTPVTRRGRMIFALGCGLTTAVIRRFGGLPEGAGYSILFMNSLAPIIDRLVRVRPLGFRKAVKGAA
ncbi:MAG: RnfABCDGE type electron transport complex subunit D [Chloroflexota bacterium]